MLGYNDQIHFLGKDTGEREVAWQGHKAGEEKSWDSIVFNIQAHDVNPIHYTFTSLSL